MKYILIVLKIIKCFINSNIQSNSFCTYKKIILETFNNYLIKIYKEYSKKMCYKNIIINKNFFLLLIYRIKIINYYSHIYI